MTIIAKYIAHYNLKMKFIISACEDVLKVKQNIPGAARRIPYILPSQDVQSQVSLHATSVLPV